MKAVVRSLLDVLVKAIDPSLFDSCVKGYCSDFSASCCHGKVPVHGNANDK